MRRITPCEAECPSHVCVILLRKFRTYNTGNTTWKMCQDKWSPMPVTNASSGHGEQTSQRVTDQDYSHALDVVCDGTVGLP